jgi:oligopeptide/dipeptide ABC transporter ATP-binding protein
VLIASALLLNPQLVLADEPTTSLDVTTQREILRLLKDLARQLHISMLVITHDFGVVAQLCDRVAVMYAGQTVEWGSMRTLLSDPKHPYTQALLACHPDRSHELTGIPGTVPSPASPPPGCRYETRCPAAVTACRIKRPPAIQLGDSTVACTLYDPAASRVSRTESALD